MSYVDTSVIVLALDRLDPRCSLAKAALKRAGDKVVSELVLVELSAVLARKGLTKLFAEKLGVNRRLIASTLILYLLRRFGLRVRAVDGLIRIPMLGDMSQPMAEALNLSERFRLRTLDLLHLAYVKLLKEMGERIDVLMTADEEFKKMAKEIEEELGVTVQFIG
ncbi:MAG: twitching motility protein PilT [Candidatus Bathyarchaeota archaeon B24]|nr:MAG: twitching motility protein PilT [Candidatus Bathyarchaeota archaeon B24]